MTGPPPAGQPPPGTCPPASSAPCTPGTTCTPWPGPGWPCPQGTPCFTAPAIGEIARQIAAREHHPPVPPGIAPGPGDPAAG